MANKILLNSSYIFGIIHVLYMLINRSNNVLLNLNIVIGIFTSIINHKLTSSIVKWIDRVIMLIGIIINLYIIETIHNIYIYYISLLFLLLSIISFILSKSLLRIPLHKNNFYSVHILNILLHIASHMFLTITHLFMLYYFQL